MLKLSKISYSTLYKEQLEAIAKYIRNARGNNMLIILEAFDELPQRIPPGSICDSLLAGRRAS